MDSTEGKDQADVSPLLLRDPHSRFTLFRWPGMLDNSVAGGIPSGLGPWESMMKESMEEASLAEDIVRSHAYPIGAVSYFFRYVLIGSSFHN
jgi:hypothetical protein